MESSKYDKKRENKPFPSRLKALLDNENKISPLGKITTQTELAQALHDAGMSVTRQTISLYTKGLATPDIEKFKFIADYFKVSYDFLLGRSNVTQRRNIDIAEKTGLTDGTINAYKLLKRMADRGNLAGQFNLLIFKHYLTFERILSLTKPIAAYVSYRKSYEDDIRGVSDKFEIEEINDRIRYEEWLIGETHKKAVIEIAEEILNDPEAEELIKRFLDYANGGEKNGSGS